MGMWCGGGDKVEPKKRGKYKIFLCSIAEFFLWRDRNQTYKVIVSKQSIPTKKVNPHWSPEVILS